MDSDGTGAENFVVIDGIGAKDREGTKDKPRTLPDLI